MLPSDCGELQAPHGIAAAAAIYSGTKGAVDSITRALTAELGPRKIRVNAIAPGVVDTEETRSGRHYGQRL